MQFIEWFLELHQLHARKYKQRPPDWALHGELYLVQMSCLEFREHVKLLYVGSGSFSCFSLYCANNP